MYTYNQANNRSLLQYINPETDYIHNLNCTCSLVFKIAPPIITYVLLNLLVTASPINLTTTEDNTADLGYAESFIIKRGVEQNDRRIMDWVVNNAARITPSKKK